MVARSKVATKARTDSCARPEPFRRGELLLETPSVIPTGVVHTALVKCHWNVPVGTISFRRHVESVQFGREKYK